MLTWLHKPSRDDCWPWKSYLGYPFMNSIFWSCVQVVPERTQKVQFCIVVGNTCWNHAAHCESIVTLNWIDLDLSAPSCSSSSFGMMCSGQALCLGSKRLNFCTCHNIYTRSNFSVCGLSSLREGTWTCMPSSLHDYYTAIPRYESSHVKFQFQAIRSVNLNLLDRRHYQYTRRLISLKYLHSCGPLTSWLPQGRTNYHRAEGWGRPAQPAFLASTPEVATPLEKGNFCLSMVVWI
jgi:hypothetical protein